MQISDLPALNATLNAVSALFLTAGYLLIRRGDRVNHQRAMLGALGASALFLVSYVSYHLNVGSKPRWTLPIWMYVSVTGVVIYLMLYQLY